MHNPAPEKHGRMERNRTPVRLGVNPPLGDIVPGTERVRDRSRVRSLSRGQVDARRDTKRFRFLALSRGSEG